jgi:hypothetical protein
MDLVRETKIGKWAFSLSGKLIFSIGFRVFFLLALSFPQTLPFADLKMNVNRTDARVHFVHMHICMS